DRAVRATFLGGATPHLKDGQDPRVSLAAWVTAADNPYFARAAVNRLWSHFFGTGLIDPVDDMVAAARTVGHPELLDLLAREFAARRFDWRSLIRAVTASRAYQLSSAADPGGRNDPRLFARMALKGLSPEQLYDSVAQATGFHEGPPADPRLAFLNDRSPRGA